MGGEQNRTNDWENPAIQGRNRRRAHSDVTPFASAEAACSQQRAASPYLRSLNGDWHFQLFPAPGAVPAGAVEAQYDDSGWPTIAVPGNWQLQGYDTPYYTDNQLPFPPDDLPCVPSAENPTGVYRRRFERPAGWEGRRIMLTLHGVDSACHVWLNGVEIGFSKDSRLPAEFDITDHVQERDNVLAVRVYRWSDGTYVENQDMWRLSGIFRDVELWSPAPLQIADLAVSTELDATCRHARIHVAAEMLNASALDRKGILLALHLFDQSGRRVTAQLYSLLDVAAGAAETVQWVVALDDPRLWSAETPYLYTLVVETRVRGDAETTPGDCVRTRVGIREVAIRDSQLCVNGRPIRMAGVNRHEHDPDTGHTVGEASMRDDIVLMKQFNINAVRTSHYPNHPLWYDLCDEYGIYVLDEANLECDGALERLADDPGWEEAFLSRVQRMVLRDRNHPCVIAWSLGNESGLGRNHRTAAAWLREADPLRPIHYHPAGEDSITDIVAPMYPSVERLEALAVQMEAEADPRPIIMCEYAHSMGNATGNLHEYWQIVNRHGRVQGGFVWDWVDQGFRRTAADGQVYWAYGGDFGDVPNDGNFCLDGLVAPDRTAHPALWELRKMAEPITSAAVDLKAGLICITNRRHTLDTGDLKMAWKIEVEGIALQEGILALPALQPGESATLQVPMATLPPDGERWLTLTFALQQATPYAPAGHVVAWQQFALPGGVDGGTEHRPAAQPPVPAAGWESAEPGGPVLRLACGRVQIHFDRQAGRLTSYAIDGRDLLAEPPVLNVWRAPTDNDEGLWGIDKMAIQWRDAGLDYLEPTVECVELVDQTPAAVQIRVLETWRPGSAGARVRSGWWDFLLLMLRMHFFQFWTPGELSAVAESLGIVGQMPDAAATTKYEYVQVLVAAADQAGKVAAVLAAAHAALQSKRNPDALASFERRMGRFLGMDDQQLTAAFTLEHSGGFHCATVYTLQAAGAVHMALDVKPFGALPLLPRVGLRLALAGDCDQVTWFGRGPQENYPDRKQGAAVGRYTGSVDEQFVRYGRPQENGNKCDVRWVDLVDREGCGLHFSAGHPLHFGVQRYTAADLAAAGHLHRLQPRPHVYCTFDYLMSGLGNESCGPRVLAAYRIPPEPYSFELKLTPILKSELRP